MMFYFLNMHCSIVLQELNRIMIRPIVLFMVKNKYKAHVCLFSGYNFFNFWSALGVFVKFRHKTFISVDIIKN